MGLKSIFSRTRSGPKPSPDAKAAVLAGEPLARPAPGSGFRRGMWVAWSDSAGKHVGVFMGFKLVDVADDGDVKLVEHGVVDVVRHEDGTTFAAGVNVPRESMRQATVEEIPPSRISGTPAEQLRRLNYKGV